MPANKSALIRYRIIDGCLTNTRRKYPKIEDIQEKIQDQIGDEISISMINKDFAEMKRIYNAPIKYCRKNMGYHYTESDFTIKEFPLTQEEVEALDFSTALLNQLKGTKLLEQFENAINKVIEGYRISKAIGKSEKLLIQMEEPVKQEGTEWIEKILKAITHKQVLAITYQPFGKESKIHCFSPYLLKEYRNRWYTVGHSDRTQKTIVLALDRILNLDNGSNRFQADNSFHPKDFFQYSFGITQIHNATPERVVLSFTPMQAQYIITHPLHHSQKKLLENINEVQIEFLVYISAELVMTVLSYGDQVKVIQPQSLKDKIRSIVTNIIAEMNNVQIQKEQYEMCF